MKNTKSLAAEAEQQPIRTQHILPSHSVIYSTQFGFVASCQQAVRTNKNTYSAHFDLMREVRVRVYTLLRGPCTNGTLVKSSNCTQQVKRPSSAGESLSK